MQNATPRIGDLVRVVIHTSRDPHSPSEMFGRYGRVDAVGHNRMLVMDSYSMTQILIPIDGAVVENVY